MRDSVKVSVFKDTCDKINSLGLKLSLDKEHFRLKDSSNNLLVTVHTVNELAAFMTGYMRGSSNA